MVDAYHEHGSAGIARHAIDPSKFPYSVDKGNKGAPLWERKWERKRIELGFSSTDASNCLQEAIEKTCYPTARKCFEYASESSDGGDSDDEIDDNPDGGGGGTVGGAGSGHDRWEKERLQAMKRDQRRMDKMGKALLNDRVAETGAQKAAAVRQMQLQDRVAMGDMSAAIMLRMGLSISIYNIPGANFDDGGDLEDDEDQ
jgi:hypothetical protein